MKPPSRSDQPVDMDRTNMLNTITEESASIQDNNTDLNSHIASIVTVVSESLISSTPLHQLEELHKKSVFQEITPIQTMKSPITHFEMASPSASSYCSRFLSHLSIISKMKIKSCKVQKADNFAFGNFEKPRGNLSILKRTTHNKSFMNLYQKGVQLRKFTNSTFVLSTQKLLPKF
ncbi:CLUMA_CG008832, isoform A [Clunio marinus]|uniref:CLUMA_CG008832, isoform A n=1 Tax=Clunio marinus TaxID=568069 RepID=A0A1J1I8M1_9DIPT|nr:CLUMA_CG008832, isoform A [Clunio marinus]